MAANKVIVNNQTILDLTSDTVTAATLKKGVTAHDASGAQITGTMEEASTSETWVLNKVVSLSARTQFDAKFTSNGADFDRLVWTFNYTTKVTSIEYKAAEISIEVYNQDTDIWADQAYRKLTFATPPTGELLTWLTANGVKQPANLAVQPSKDVTVTSNGTTEITPDAPYDALKKVNLTANVVADVPLVTVTFKAASFGNEVNSPSEDEIYKMKFIGISAFVDGNISLANMRDFSEQWGGMVFPFDVVVPQGSSVTIVASASNTGGSTTVTNAQVAKLIGDIEGISAVVTVYNITDGATITIDVG